MAVLLNTLDQRRVREAKSDLSVKLDRGGAVESPTRAAAKTIVGNPPSYGAQHLQDALWKGGNEALPPGWNKFDGGDGTTQYQDDSLVMASFHRPLPGIRLDYPGQLPVPGCEWYISPLGQSYFVNHNTLTTSWKKPTPEHPPGSLRPERTIQAHSRPIWNLAHLGTTSSVISASSDGSIRHWTRDGKAIGQPWRTSGGTKVGPIAVSQDETRVISGSGDGRIRLWDVNEGRIIGDPWEGHNGDVRCLDWSPNGGEIASGSEDGTIRRWNPGTGRQIARPIATDQVWLYSVKYSPQGDKFASSASDGMIRVWSKEGGLLMEIKAHDDGNWVGTLCWSKDGTCIFSGSGDCNIRKWRLIDGKELLVLRGHTRTVKSLCLSIDGCYLISASNDCSVRIWDLNTSKPVGEPLLHDDEVRSIAMFSDGQYMASAGLDGRIYLWNLEGILKQIGGQIPQDGNTASDAKLKEHVSPLGDTLDISTKSKQRPNNTSASKYGDNFWGNDANCNTRSLAAVTNPSPRWRNLFDFGRFNTQPVHASSQMPHQRRRWSFSFFTKKTPSIVDVATAQDVDRIYIVPPTDEELAAALQSGDEINDSPRPDGAAAGIQSPQKAGTQGRDSVAGTDESSCVPGCCGFSRSQ